MRRARVAVIVAMEAEAAPLVAALGAEPVDPPPWAAALPCRLHRNSRRDDVDVLIAVNGPDPATGVDSIGTQAAALTTHVAVVTHEPDLVISAGTAGGWRRAGAEVGDVYVAWDRLVFHDRRIDLPGFDAYGEGHFGAADVREAATAAGCRLGVVTTGDSLDECPEDRARILASGAEVKDMEAASVAWVSGLHGVPVTAVKAITDIVDGPEATTAQFVANLAHAGDRLRETLPALLAALPETGFAESRRAAATAQPGSGGSDRTE